MQATTEYLSVTDTAKLIRKALKAAHPGTKFSVRSRSYAGGASIDISWTDGPTADEVDRTAKLYQGSTFDGMTDMKSYHSTLLGDPDGTVRDVRFGADHVFTHRDVTDGFVARLAAERPAPRLGGWDGHCRGCGGHVFPGGDAWSVDYGQGHCVGACSPECAARVLAIHTAA